MTLSELYSNEKFIDLQREVRNYIGYVFYGMKKVSLIPIRIFMTPIYANILRIFCSDLIESYNGNTPSSFMGIPVIIRKDINNIRIDNPKEPFADCFCVLKKEFEEFVKRAKNINILK